MTKTFKVSLNFLSFIRTKSNPAKIRFVGSVFPWISTALILLISKIYIYKRPLIIITTKQSLVLSDAPDTEAARIELELALFSTFKFRVCISISNQKRKNKSLNFGSNYVLLQFSWHWHHFFRVFPKKSQKRFSRQETEKVLIWLLGKIFQIWETFFRKCHL